MVAQVGGWSLRLGQLFLHLNRALAVILLQIVMVRPETHLVKKHESLSITSESQLKKKQGVRNWRCLGLYVARQLGQTPKLFITVY